MSMYENVGLTSLDYIEEILHLRKALADVSDECSKAYDKIANFEQQRWVSVKDRLPEDDGKYMVYCKDDFEICEFDAESQTFGYTYDDYDEMYSHLVCWDDGINKKVTHWMPIPQKPESEDDVRWVDDDTLPNEDMIPDNEFIGGF